MKSNFRNSILLKISALITILCLIIMAYSAYGLYSGWKSYQKAIELRAVQDMAQNFSEGLENFMFERGRTNVVLSNEQIISKENRAFLNERRGAADEAFEAGFLVMEKAFPDETEKLWKEYEYINTLRIEVDAEAAKPLSERNVKARKIWFDSCTDYINTVINKINIIRQLAQDNSDLSNCFSLIVDSLYFRNIVGNESSIITSAISGKGKLSNEDNDVLLFLRGEEKQVWSQLEKTLAMLDSRDLSAAFEKVQDQYYLGFRLEQDRFIELADKDQLYEGAGKEMANLSVPALDSILQLSDAAVKEIEAVNQKNIENELKSLLVGMAQLFTSILIVIFVPIYFRKRFVQPLNEIIIALDNIRQGKEDTYVPHTKREGEIGKLARGADMLKNSILEEKTLKQEIEETVLQLEELSTKDSLTCLYNRRYMSGQFEELAHCYKKDNTVFSVILCDIDNFKEVNDRYGHECGDKTLVCISELLSSYCRESDVLARWGGEEFLFLLPKTNRKTAKNIAEKMRLELQSADYLCEFNKLNITMTFGVAEYSEGEGIQGTVRKADIALLQGKNSGRNQVVVF